MELESSKKVRERIFQKLFEKKILPKFPQNWLNN